MPKTTEEGGYTTTHAPKSHCLRCGTVIDAHTPSPLEPDQHSIARPGDPGICLKCGAVMILDEELRVRRMTDAEMEAIQSRQKADAGAAQYRQSNSLDASGAKLMSNQKPACPFCEAELIGLAAMVATTDQGKFLVIYCPSCWKVLAIHPWK